ncbi:hypothetical protein BH23CHL4_BH23CHL4_25650 [soil metagenome]
MDPLGIPVSDTDVSRRDVVVRFGGAGLAAILLAAAHASHLSAQDASPAATPAGPVGISATLMGTGQPASAPGLELSLRRITIAPGSGIPPHSHPGALVIFVEAGTWGYTALGGTIQLTRAAAEGTPAAVEDMPMGTEVILNPGDWLFVEDPEDDIRNAGEDDVVLFVAGLTRIGEPFTTLHE